MNNKNKKKSKKKKEDVKSYNRLLSGMIPIKTKKPQKFSAAHKKFKMEMRKQRKLLEKEIKVTQDSCPHLQGSSPLGEFCGVFRTSIVWHEFAGNVIQGVCTNCLRVFTPKDKDYYFWKSKPKGNFLSKSYTEVIPITQAEYLEGAKDQFCSLDKEIATFDEILFVIKESDLPALSDRIKIQKILDEATKAHPQETTS